MQVRFWQKKVQDAKNSNLARKPGAIKGHEQHRLWGTAHTCTGQTQSGILQLSLFFWDAYLQ